MENVTRWCQEAARLSNDLVSLEKELSEETAASACAQLVRSGVSREIAMATVQNEIEVRLAKAAEFAQECASEHAQFYVAATRRMLAAQSSWYEDRAPK